MVKLSNSSFFRNQLCRLFLFKSGTEFFKQLSVTTEVLFFNFNRSRWNAVRIFHTVHCHGFSFWQNTHFLRRVIFSVCGKVLKGNVSLGWWDCAAARLGFFSETFRVAVVLACSL